MALQDLSDMLNVGLPIRREEEVVVQVNENKLVEYVRKNFIHQWLKLSWLICELK